MKKKSLKNNEWVSLKYPFVNGRVLRKYPGYANTYEIVIPGVGVVTRSLSELQKVS